MKCARCGRYLSRIFAVYMGKPFGPVCAKMMSLNPERKDRAKAAVRDCQTRDMFEN